MCLYRSSVLCALISWLSIFIASEIIGASHRWKKNGILTLLTLLTRHINTTAVTAAAVVAGMEIFIEQLQAF